MNLLSIKDLAQYLKVHTSTVYKYVKDRELPGFKIGGIWRFEKEKIDGWIKKYENIGTNNLTNKEEKLINKDVNHNEGGLKKLAKLKGQIYSNRGYNKVFSRKTNLGTLRWYLYFYDLNGRRKREVTDARTEEEALILLNEALQRKTDKIEGKVKFKDFAEDYIKNYAMIRKRSWRKDENALKISLTPFFGELRLSEITSAHVHHFISKKLNAGLKKNSVNRYLQLLRKIMNFAKECDYEIKENPVKSSHLFSEVEFRRSRVLSYEEEERLMLEAPQHLRNVIEFALKTGFRLGEILSLRIEDVDFENDIITIRQEVNKSGKEDRVPMNSNTKELLQRLIKENGKTDFVFNYFNGKRKNLVAVKSVKSGWLSACRRAGLENLQFRDLRRTFASRLHEKGIDPLIISRLLRHASFSISEQVYIKSTIGMMREAIKVFDEKPLTQTRPIEEKKEIKDFTSYSFSVN